MDAVQNAILNAVAVILTTLVGIITRKLVSFLEEKKILERINNKRDVVSVAVGAIEQVYKIEKGPEKLEKAKKMALEMLTSNGLQVTELELKGFLEDAVFEMNKGAKEALEKEIIEDKNILQ